MNKKLLLIPIAIGIVALLILLPPHKVHGTKAEMEVPSTTVDMSKTPKAVTVFLDNSGSMQGYVNFASKSDGFETAKQTMITNVADFMGNVDASCGLVSKAECGPRSYTAETLIQAMRNYSAFSGAITELDGLVSLAIAAASDTAVSVIVSDMVLSYGKSAIAKSGNKNYNRQELPALSSLVGNQFKKLKKADIEVLILKYESDFNGSFYYNCTENIEPCEFKNTLMKKRPYYFFIVGKDEYIKSLCGHKCFPAPDAVFSTLEVDDDDMMIQSFSITAPKGWTVGGHDEKGDSETVCLWTPDNFGDAAATFNITFNPIEVPLYAQGAIEAEFDRDVVSNVTFDAQALNSFVVTLNSFNVLPKEDDDVEIKLSVIRGNDAAASSVESDYGVDVSALEGKTWGFESILDKIYEAYDIEAGDKETIAKLKFAISKK